MVFCRKLSNAIFMMFQFVSGEGKDETNERQDNSGIANGKLFSYINEIILK